MTEPTTKNLVAVVTGSDSDWPVMEAACKQLDELQVSYIKKVVSAHRTPDFMASFAKAARSDGIRVIIAGAGGAAHLPGMIAAYTTLPVIGVPVQGKTLQGLDSLLSIVQMPSGVPVATVAINGAKNAGLLAAKILAISSAEIEAKLQDFKERQAKLSLEKQLT